jgi:hypothetical protein
MSRPDTSIIIVSWKVKSLLHNCLASIRAHHRGDSEIVVVDNDSADGTVPETRSQFPEIKVIENRENVGFSKANNIGIQHSKGSAILFLNPDTLLSEDTVSKMREVFRQDPSVGAVGCMLVDENRKIDFQCAKRLPTIFNLLIEPYLYRIGIRCKTDLPMREWDHRDNRHVECLMGACLMVPRDVLEIAGYWDESMFMYAEDVELCHRISRHGYKLFYLADSAVIHFGQRSAMQDYVNVNAAAVRSMRKYFSRQRSPLYGSIYQFMSILNLIIKSFILLLFAPVRSKRHIEEAGQCLGMAFRLILQP